MRTLVVALGLAVVVAIGGAACGPSQREVQLAKVTTYRGDFQMMYAKMKLAVEDKHKLLIADETKLRIQTIPRWYNPEGQSISSCADLNPRCMPDRSVRISLIAEMLPVEKDWVVQVTMDIIRYRSGQSAPDRILPNEILPGWIPGKVDQLQYAIYEELKEYEVAAPSGNIPQRPDQRPSVDPDEPPPGSVDPGPADPSAGSAGSTGSASTPDAGDGSAAGSAAPAPPAP